MEKNKTVLTMDFGTQSLRVSLIDKKGNIVAIVKKQYNPIYYSEQKGYAEQHADFYWDTLLSALSDLADQYEDLMDTIVGSTITTFGQSFIASPVSIVVLIPYFLASYEAVNTILFLNGSSCATTIGLFFKALFSLISQDAKKAFMSI